MAKKQTITDKILSSHIVSGKPVRGEKVSIHIDQALTQDATGTFVYLELEALNPKRAECLAVSYVDHNTLEMGSENSDDHAYLESVASRYGVVYSPAGNGICHTLHTEYFSKPGATIIGSDSHTPTSSSLCAFAVGAGGLSVASSMAGLPFELTYPRVVNIKLKGKLNSGASAKDVVLKVLSHFGVTGNQNTVFEYSGEGVKNLTLFDRATICNMGAEAGVTTSIFPSDEITHEFLKEMGREGDFIPLFADEGAEYDDSYYINLSLLRPQVALPHSPGNVKSVSEIVGLPINQVLIGSCTNSSFEDLMAVYEIVKGKRVKRGIDAAIATGSRTTTLRLIKAGAMEAFIKAGFRIEESACGFCIGSGLSPQTDGVSLRTNNRNFEGRSGTKSAKVYLVSPETAAVSAITGVLTEPKETYRRQYDVKAEPIDLFEREYNPNREIIRLDSIGEFPTFDPLPDSLSLTIGLVVGDKITTDHIMPAGSRLKYRSNIQKYSTFVFEGVDPSFSSDTKARKQKGKETAVVAGLSYGQGSSREHAAICPRYLGVRAIIAESIERIHMANLYNFGILPLILDNKSDKALFKKGDVITIVDIHNSVKSGHFTILCGDKKISAGVQASDDEKESLLKGSLLNVLKSKSEGGKG